MNKKFFVLNEAQNPLTKEEIKSIELKKAETLKGGYDKNRDKTKERIETESISLKHTEGRIIIVIDIEGKNSHTFADGTKIYLGRQFNNLNRRETEPVNAYVVDAEYIPKGAEILIHPNAIHDSNRIFGYSNITAEEGNSVRYYSIEETSAFLFNEENEWKPLKGFATALRAFKPYEGTIEGVKPEKIENVLYLTSGELSGKVCHTLKAVDYEIIFMGREGREERKIRCRHYEKENHDREEITAIDGYLTEKVKSGKLLIGLSEYDCEYLK